MTPDELRALADALEPMARAPRFEDFDVPGFCAWVRACADAEPVAWVDVTDSYEGPYIFHGKELLPAGRHDLYTHPAPAAPHYAMLDSHRRQVEQAIQSAEHPSGMSTHDGKARIDASILRRMLAIIDSLPAAPKEENNVWKQIIPDDAPHAEPKREDRAVRDLLAIIHCDGGHHPEAVGLDQSILDAMEVVIADRLEIAMTKREALSDDEILDTATAAGLRFSMYSDDVETRAAIKRLARAIEREHGIGVSDE